VEDAIKKKINTNAYTGKSYEKLLVALEDFWDMVDEHDMLRPMNPTHERIRDAGLSMVVKKEDDTNTAKEKKQRCLNRKVTFRFVRDILLHDKGKKKFTNHFKKIQENMKEEEESEVYTQANLKECFDAVLTDILPTDAYAQQVDYMKHCKKPWCLSVKDWLERLKMMNEKLRWLSPDGSNLDQCTMNRDCVLHNLPMEWKIKLKESWVW